MSIENPNQPLIPEESLISGPLIPDFLIKEPLITEEELLAMPASAYMNKPQLAFFWHVLQKMREATLAHIQEARANMSGEKEVEPDELDLAQREETNMLMLRIMSRETKLLKKIDEALERIRNGSYGYCEVTGEPIGLRRLLARPTATLCIEEKERQEQIERNYRDRD